MITTRTMTVMLVHVIMMMMMMMIKIMIVIMILVMMMFIFSCFKNFIANITRYYNVLQNKTVNTLINIYITLLAPAIKITKRKLGGVRLKAFFFVDFPLFLTFLAKISFNLKMTQLSYSPSDSIIICEVLDDFSGVLNV